MQSWHSGPSACLKFKTQTLDAKFAFWAFCLPKIQGPNLGCKVCIPGLLRAQNSRPKPWMQSLHSESSAAPNLGCKVCILGLLPAQKSKAQTLDAKFAFWVLCLPKIQGPNLGFQVIVCLHGAFPVQVADVTRQGHQRPAWHASLGNWHARCPHPQAGRVAGEAPSHAQRLPRALLGCRPTGLLAANLQDS